MIQKIKCFFGKHKPKAWYITVGHTIPSEIRCKYCDKYLVGLAEFKHLKRKIKVDLKQ